MKVILLKDVSKLGRKYDTKDVSSGYALNLLIPKGLAIAATSESIKKVESEKKRSEGDKKVQDDLMLKSLGELEGKSLNITGKANEKGHLFAGIHKEQVSQEITKATRLQIDPESIIIDHPIKELGEHKIEVMGAGKKVHFTLVISKA